MIEKLDFEKCTGVEVAEKINEMVDTVNELTEQKKNLERTIYSMLYQKFDAYRIQIENMDSRLRKLEPLPGHTHGVENYESCSRCGKTFYNLDKKLMCPDCELEVFGKRTEKRPNPYHVHRS